MQFPIRLVESGPAAGAIVAGQIAAECGLPQVLSFDMGGTTAKICLIDNFQPTLSRSFEVDRVYRFQKGSGLPIRVPVVEMVEIGAGGGSVAKVDGLNRLRVGPESSGAEPGPACYGRGGTAPTVTDADLLLGRIDPDRFAGGSYSLNTEAAAEAVVRAVATPLGLDKPTAALGLCEVVDENMANAARVHAIERGRSLAQRTLIAFGGAAPLHAARLADKLGMEQVIIPSNAGVASAIGFLKAPFSYEVIRSRHMRLSDFDPVLINTLLSEMTIEARDIVARGAPDHPLTERRSVEMRYYGQGHEITLDLPNRDLTSEDANLLHRTFDQAYGAQFGRSVAGMAIEILTFTLRVSTTAPQREKWPEPPPSDPPPRPETRSLLDPATASRVSASIYPRAELKPGTRVIGPAIIVEAQTSTVVPVGFESRIHAAGHIILQRMRSSGS
jgi:N-methylhydantoinase A